jgi:hypothetical protein
MGNAVPGTAGHFGAGWSNEVGPACGSAHELLLVESVIPEQGMLGFSIRPLATMGLPAIEPHERVCLAKFVDADRGLPWVPCAPLCCWPAWWS